jgi:hypothetical protein
LTVSPEQITKLDRMISDFETNEETLIELVAELKTRQNPLFDWVSHKFGAMTSPNALLGVTIVALALLKGDME